MKVRFFQSVVLTTFAALFVAQSTAFSAVTVLTVPVSATASVTTPHTAYPVTATTEVKIVLGATVPSAVGSTDHFTFQWSFGDGTSSTSAAVTNPYDISVQHQYPASAGTGTQWTATVTVTDTTNSQTGSANYYVIQEPNTLAYRVNVAIDWGLWYMHQTMWRGTTTVSSVVIPWGGWDTQSTACTNVNGASYDCAPYGVINAENVQAFEVSGHFQNGPATDPFTDDVARGFARMFTSLATQTAASNTYTYNPATANYICQDGTLPTTSVPTCTGHGGQHFYNAGATSCPSAHCVITFDANSNGIQTYSNDGSGEYIYTTSPFMEAMIAANTPNATAPTGAAHVLGQTFQTIVQDMADYYNYSQYGGYSDVAQGYTRGDSQYAGGAWLYGPQQGDDNSTSQWAAIGLITANRSSFNISVPAIVTDANNAWVTNAQDLTQAKPAGADSFASAGNLGAYGYRGSWAYSQEWGPFAVTPSGMVQMALDGVGRTANTAFGDSTTDFDQRWNNSETFYADNFCNSVTTYGNGGSSNAYYAPRAYMYGLFSFTKSMLLHDPGFNLVSLPYLRTQTPHVFTTNPNVPANSIDWYGALSPANGGLDACDGVAQTLVTFQATPAYGTFDGHWYGNTYDISSSAQSPYETAWALIMLNKTVVTPCIPNLAGSGSASGSAPARIDLSWSNQASSTSYNVLRGSTNGGPYTLIGNTSSTAYSDTSGLSNGTTYYYVVQPLNGTTQVCQSNQALVAVPAVATGRH